MTVLKTEFIITSISISRSSGSGIHSSNPSIRSGISSHVLIYCALANLAIVVCVFIVVLYSIKVVHVFIDGLRICLTSCDGVHVFPEQNQPTGVGGNADLVYCTVI